MSSETENPRGLLTRVLRACLEQKLVVALAALFLIGWGVSVAPFDWDTGRLPRDPVPVDAIPNLGENQQIVFTEWPGRSPRDVDDQITYPLTVELMGIPGVAEVRSSSSFGFSMIFLIFDEDTEFYWSRSRILEKLNSLSAGTLPDGVSPALGPDATALGQVFWYTIEGRDPDGNPAGGWDLDELRTVQDWYVRHGLLSAEGISEIASIGGFVSEYQVDVDPEALRAYDVTMSRVIEAARASNLDVGAGVTEINSVEYLLRGRGFVEDLGDLEEAVVDVRDDGIPIRVKDVATVVRGPAQRRGALTVGGAEAVGGVAVVREGYNPLQAIHNLKEKIEEMSPGLRAKAKAVVDWRAVDADTVRSFAGQQGFSAFTSGRAELLDHAAWLGWMQGTPRAEWPEWLTRSELTVVPFYDRTELIYETLGTLSDALIQQILVTILVVILLLLHLRSALLISAMLPLAVLMSFIMMKLIGVDANVVALAGIAISIGAIVDMGVVVTENVHRHLGEAPPDEPRAEVVLRGSREVSSAILTAISTTVVGFLPVFTMTGAEGRMFTPLAYTKTFVLLAAVVVALAILPAALHVTLASRSIRSLGRSMRVGLAVAAAVSFTVGVSQGWIFVSLAALALFATLLYDLAGLRERVRARVLDAVSRSPRGQNVADRLRGWGPWIGSALAAAVVVWILAGVWEPLGPEPGRWVNALFVALLIGTILGVLAVFRWGYVPMLRWCLRHKAVALALPIALVVSGPTIWLGFDRTFGVVPAAAERIGLGGDWIRQGRAYQAATRAFPGLGREFMPSFDEGTFLWMPTLAYHGSIGEALDMLRHQDLAIESVPEVESVHGKIGRVESALDPAPVGMLESVVHYKSEYATDENGRLVRQWRDHIESPDDIWEEIVNAAAMPGVTSAPMLQPIETRLLMLQTGMRAPIGLKLRAPDLDTLEAVTRDFEDALRDVHAVRNETISADRVVGKPYLEMVPDREAIARHGLNAADVQQVFAAAVGGREVTTTVEGRERFPVRVRYQRAHRQDLEAMEQVLVETRTGAQIPLVQVADIEYRRGPQMIRSEDTFLTSYVTFGSQPGWAEVEVVDAARAHIDELVASGDLEVPAGVSWKFAGNYEHQVRAARTLAIALPVALLAIFLLLYLQFRSVLKTAIVFTDVGVAFSGGFVMIYLFGQPWFGDFAVLGANMRELFNLQPLNLSVAVWVGFLALFGIAVDNAVIVTTYMDQLFARERPASTEAIRDAIVRAGARRLRPCLITTATTILALLPVLTSTGRGSDLMIPMAIPTLGGMLFVLLTLVSVPVLYALAREKGWIRPE